MVRDYLELPDHDGLPPMPSEVNPQLRDAQGKVWLTIGEAAGLFPCDEATINRWKKKREKEGRPIHKKIFGKVYIYRPRLLHAA